ncbi:MAG: RsiV family protein, partial [Acetivibrio ethanolgignens]
MNQKMEELKRQYEEIPMPEELKGKVEEAIKRGQEAERREKYSKKRGGWLLILKGGGAVAAAALLSIVVLSNTSAETAYALENIPVIGAISRVVTLSTFADKQGDYEASIDTPKIESEEGEKKNLTEGKVNLNQTMADYTETIEKAYEADLKAAGDLGKETVDTSYQVLTDNKRLLSIRIDTTVVMASSNAFSKIYHLDKTTGKQLVLKDFFRQDSNYIDVLTESLLKQMKKANEEEEAAYFIDTEYGDEFNFTQLDPEQNCYWDEKGNLVVVFDKYQVSA